MLAIILVVVCIASAVVYSDRKNITLTIDGDSQELATYSNTVGELLKSKRIVLSEKDKISVPLDTVLTNHSIIAIKRAVNIVVAVDGSEGPLLTAEETVDAMLFAEGIVLKENDKVIPSRESAIAADLRVEVIRVDTKNVTETKAVKYKEVIKSKTNLPNNIRKVETEGRDGEKKITYQVTYENGKEVSRKVIKEAISKAPIDRVVLQGTYPLVPVSRGGRTVGYSKVIQMKATAYWAVRGVGKTYTASGKKAVRDETGYSTIAVDPKLFPYGTKMFVEGYGFAVAADTGTAIKGHKIDVYFNTKKEALRWGLKSVNVYILDKH